jgi:hypothetical protein
MTAALSDSPPPSADYFSAVTTVGMHLNDKWGCCVFAGDANVIQGITGYGSGNEVVVPDSDVLKAYEKVGHFNPNDGPPGQNPTDQGAQVPDGLKYLQNTGMAGHKIAGYGDIAVNATAKIKTAIAEFGYVSTGVNLPNSAMDQFNAGPPAGEEYPVWDVVADDGGIDGGHCVVMCGYNAKGFLIWTWDAVVLVTYAWWAKYGGEAWAVLSHDWVNAATGKDPEGVDTAALGAEFQAVTGTNPFKRRRP